MGNTDKFDMIANLYDTPERVQIAKISSDAIRSCLVDTKSKNAIDFGCGTGLVGISLLDDFKSVLFLDTSQNMLDQIKLKIQNANTLCFDLEKDSLSDLHTDYILMVQVLLHIKDFKSVLLKLYDVLNPGGNLIIVDFDKNNEIVSDIVHNGFDQIELSKIMINMGYRNIHSKTIYTDSKIFMGHDASLFILDSNR